MQQDTFKQIIRDIYSYYKILGWTNETLAEEIGIDTRMFYNWKQKKHVPRDASMEGLIGFLKANGGGEFLSRLNNLPVIYTKDSTAKRGEFANSLLTPTDITEIRDSFPRVDELQYINLTILYEDKREALQKLIPDKDITEMVKFKTRFEKRIKRLEETFGIHDIQGWKDYVIAYMEGPLPTKEEDIEIMGQKVINSLTNCYLIKKGKIDQWQPI